MIANSVLESRALSAKGAAALGGSNSSVRVPRVLTDRARASEVRGTTGEQGYDKVRQIEDDGVRTARSKPVDRQFINLDLIDDRASASDYAGKQVIFVLLVPKGSSDARLKDLGIDPSHLTSRDNRALIDGATLQVDLPSAVRLSTVRDEILAGIARASLEPAPTREAKLPAEAPVTLPNLTRREREVLQMILEGHPNKNIAADLRISMRTVENHRAKVMKKTGSKSLPALVRLAIAAGAMPAAAASR